MIPEIQMGKRIEAKELRAQQRQPIQDIVPLSTPFVVYIDPTNLCNFRCQFCPTGDKELLKQVGRPAKSMSFDLFRKIVDDLKSFDQKLKLASIYKDGEPLVNKHFPEMIRYLKDADVAERIWTKTNGSLLNPALNQRIADSGLDMICISVESVSREGYKRIADVDIDYDKFRENVMDLYSRRGKTEIYIKIADSGLTQEEVTKFYSDFQGISTFIGIEKLMGWSFSEVKDFTLGTNPTTYDGLPLVPKKACVYPFYVMAVNSNGSVSVCGNDWSQSTAVGDVTRESLKDIWNCEKLFQFQKMMLENRRSENRACANCYYLQIVPDNIDNYMDQMLKRLYVARNLVSA